MTPVDRERVRACVVEAVAEGARRSGTPDVVLDDGTDVLGSGIVDSLAFVDLLMVVEERLGTPLALDRLDFEAIDSLGALVDQIHGLQEPAVAEMVSERTSP
jgi:acyl carrier protein